MSDSVIKFLSNQAGRRAGKRKKEGVRRYSNFLIIMEFV